MLQLGWKRVPGGSRHLRHWGPPPRDGKEEEPFPKGESNWLKIRMEEKKKNDDEPDLRVRTEQGIRARQAWALVTCGSHAGKALGARFLTSLCEKEKVEPP